VHFATSAGAAYFLTPGRLAFSQVQISAELREFGVVVSWSKVLHLPPNNIDHIKTTVNSPQTNDIWEHLHETI